MRDRIELHEKLCTILGSRNVYFQPPETIKMEYPCIVYKRESIPADHANNARYKEITKYSMTVMSMDPDSDIHLKLLKLPYTSYERHFVYNNLHHDVVQIHY